MKFQLDRMFDTVFVRAPSLSYKKCASSNPEKDSINVSLAREQHRAYCSLLKESGIEVIQLPTLEEYPDSVFMQDPALLGLRLSVIGRFSEVRRRGEERALKTDLENYARRVGNPVQINEPATLEGGDILVTDRGLFVGQSQRTNVPGITQLAECLGAVSVRPIGTNLFHLLCGCAYLNQRTMLIVPDLINPNMFPGFKFIPIPKEESYAADALYLGDQRVLIPSGFHRTVTKLSEAGYIPVEVDVSEFWKGDGGVTCLSSPIYHTF